MMSGPPSRVTIPVRLFARYAELLGAERLTVEVTVPATVAAVLEQLRADHPAAAVLGQRPLVAIGLGQVGLDAAIPPGAEVAFLPPLSGG
jgi:molybdopterin converting factor small subunit